MSRRDNRPNILLITADQYRFPRFSYGPDHGFAEPLKRILGFHEELGDDNPYARFFPGLLRLRRNAVLLRNHTIATSACTPSRTAIYTGQYGTKTGVTQTDGLFKNGDSPNFPWLADNGIPTLGNWLREAGYATHYFGKWHISNPPDHSLERYGFDDWEESYPEPHGPQANNLGIYRDAGFTDSVCAFLRRQALALNYDVALADATARNPSAPPPDPSDVKPWFAVASFVNPHDIATYPAAISQALPSPDESDKRRSDKTQSVFGPLTVPHEGQSTPPPTAGTIAIPLNPQDFPQDCAHAPPAPTMHEKLADKPSCQFDYSYKVGLGLAAKTGYNIAKSDSALAVKLALQSSIPFQLADNPDDACLKFIQLYAWLHAVVDPHIDHVLQTLEETGQATNTIVVFLADHGEYAAAHGMMMEKWHTAYQEALHVPVVVQFPPDGADKPLRATDALTSHIDILPTILGLVDIRGKEREAIARSLAETRPVPPLPGADLSAIIKGEADDVIEPDGERRRGVLFITDDEITAPLPPDHNAHSQKSLEEFDVYCKTVDAVREGTPQGKGPVPRLTPGPVRQPNHVRCVRTNEYKLSRYFDPSGEAPQQWEMYDLQRDPNEVYNLVEVDETPPAARTAQPPWTSQEKAQEAADALAELLVTLERRDL
jgi:arylsulfatase A-like enzyme